VTFQADAAGEGSIAFAKGRSFDQVSFNGTLLGRTDQGKPAPVKVFSAAYPSSPDQMTRREHLPALAVVAVETQFLRSDRATLTSVFYLPHFVEGGHDLDPSRTLVLTMHGSVEVEDDDQMKAGSPCIPGADPRHSIFLDPPAVATLVGLVRGPQEQQPNALINLGCFSSTRPAKGISFNEELANLLKRQGDVAVYGPPYAGIVTIATQFGHWRKLFGQRLEDEVAVRSVPIRFQRIQPATKLRKANPMQQGTRAGRHDEPELSGSVVITNDYMLAGDLSAFSPDFSQTKRHEVDRTLME
jgi:hypothetical protein